MTIVDPSATSSPWTVSTKRKTPTSGSSVRKRQRLSDDLETRNRARRQQKTLTQIQWTPNNRGVRFEDGDGIKDGLEYIEHGEDLGSSGREQRSKRTDEGTKIRVRGKGQSRRGLQKRNSTLTQMHFFSSEIPEVDLGEDYLPSGMNDAEPATGGTGGDHNQATASKLQQVDGNWDSPKKTRRKRCASNERDVFQHPNMAPVDSGYRPTKRKKETAGEEKLAGRRRSDRLKKKVLSDPDQNLEYFSAAFAEDLHPTRTVLDRAKNRPQLVTQDIMDLDENQENLPLSQGLNVSTKALNTPRKRREVIPSSQSPESLPPSTSTISVVDLVTPKKSIARAPLRKLCVNTPNARASSKNLNEKTSPFQSTIGPSPKRKICVLKLPKKAPQTTTRVENSQRNIWSIQPTSSPRPQNKRPAQAPSTPVRAEKVSDIKEIEETSQSKSDLDKDTSSSQRPEKSLQSLTAILRAVRTGQDATTVNMGYALSQQTSREPKIIVRDFLMSNVAEMATPKPPKRQQPFVSAQAKNVDIIQGSVNFDAGDANEEDVLSTLSTPIANDTQFNHELASRISTSPIPSSSMKALETYNDDLQAPKVEKRTNKDTQFFPLAPPAFIRHSVTTLVPLNDTAPPSSSSPVLPHMHTGTQRSVHPASLRHQSQISTQEPTQHYLPLSSLSPYDAPGASQEPDRITIKDSSSIQLPLSQVPNYENEDEDGSFGVDLDLDNYGAGDAIDEDENDEKEKIDDEYIGQYEDLDQHPPVTFQDPRHQQRPSQSTNQQYPTSNAPEAYQAQPRSHPPNSSQQAETQSNFTQGGHVTAARIARMKAQGLIPQNYVPRPDFKVPTDARELLPAWAFEGLESDSD